MRRFAAASLDRERALHAGLLVAGDRAEEGVLARLQVDGRRGRAAGDDVGPAEVLAARVGDVDVVAERRVVREVDRDGPWLRCRDGLLLKRELAGRVGADL